MLDTLRQDFVYAVRVFARNPGFTAVALLILTLGIGATTSIFSVVDGVLLKTLPYEEPERVVSVRHGHVERGFHGIADGAFSPPDFEDLAAEAESFERLAAYRFTPGQSTANLVHDGRPERIDVAVVSGELFPLLGRHAALGRTITPQDAVPGRDAVVVLSHALWRTRFGADPGIAGESITMDGATMEVVGVMPASFRFPSPEAQAWVPISLVTEDKIPRHRKLRWMQVVGRLRPGVSESAALAETRGILARLAVAHADSNEGWTAADVTPLHESLVGEVRPALLILLAATGLVLLVVCANLANLLLARGAGRGREVAVRLSLGASRWRLVRQQLTESLLLSLAGGALGLILAAVGVRAVKAMSAGSLPLVDAVGLDWRMASFAVAASLATGVLFGLLPAWTASGLRPASWLRAGGAGGGGNGGHGRLLRGALVMGETALAVVLVIASGLMLKSFWKLVRVDPGFETEQVLTFSIRSPANLPVRDGETEDRGASLIRYQREILEAVERVPGVVSVGASKTQPLASGGEPLELTTVDAGGNERTLRPDSGMQIVSPGYFETLGVTVLEGRTFAEHDPPQAVVINQAMAEQYWPDESAVGQRLGTPPRQIEIIGVVAGVRHEGMAQAARGAMYVQPTAGPRTAMTVYARTASDPMAAAPAIREAVWSVNPHQPISNLGRLTQTLDADVARPRFFTTLLATFAGLALVLAALGIYGVVAYTVGQRTGELGIRVALGARAADVLRLILSQAMRVCTAGLALGLLGSFWLSQLLAGLLYGVEPRDPATFVGVALLLGTVALLASFVPALRATRVDPVTALRGE